MASLVAPGPSSAARILLLLMPAAAALLRSGQDRTAPFPRPGELIGKAACLDCHEEQGERLLAGHHAGILESTLLRGCETCHGPGKLHAESDDNDPALITHPPSLGSRAVVGFCGRCHADAAALHGGDLDGFLAAGKTCTSCHRVHEAVAPPPHPDLAFASRRTQVAAAGNGGAGAARCVECHPLRDELLGRSAHHHLAAAAATDGCETCHGPGKLHAETGGLARLITRPDRAADGIATCRSCHDDVDPVEFHWRGRHRPLLGDDLTCTTCHRVHEPVAPAPTAATAAGAAVDATLAAAAAPVTNALCARCHAPALAVLAGTVHATLGETTTPLAEGCGACHPGARDHALAGGRKHLVQALRGSDAETQLRACGQCHGGEPALAHVAAGSHHRHDVSCLSCHSPAERRGDTRHAAQARCDGCHAQVAAEFRRPNRHPVPENAMGCGDCHDVHGARPKIRDLRLRQDACTGCHREYRGPFVFAHQASRSDGCVVCHLPHGASNKRLLRQHTTQQNCLQCHADFPIFHDQTSGAVFTNCLNCHTEVHGSNHSRYFFR